MKTVVAVRHVHFEGLGTLGALLEERGHAVRHVDAAVGGLLGLDASEPDLLVILGGPVGAFDDDAYPWLVDELALVRERLRSGRPILGICLGAQLIARALGGGVRPMGRKEIGFGAITLTEEGRSSPLACLGATPVLHWHGDQFDIPPGAARLAGTEICANQAFSLGANVLGLQFHLEADTQEIEHWLVGHACELGQAALDPRALRTQAKAVRGGLSRAARDVFTAWLDALAP